MALTVVIVYCRGPMMHIRIDAERLDPRKIQPALEGLRRGEVIIYPSDTGYAFACALTSSRGMAALRRLKGLHAKHLKPLTMMVENLNAIGRYGAMSNEAFRVVRRLLPGPYTIVLRATGDVPRAMKNRAHEIGMRMPEHPVCRALLDGLGEPLITGSVSPGEDEPELEEPEFFESRYGNDVFAFLDSGPLWPEPSTVLRFEGAEIEVLRAGQGPIPA